MKIQFLNGGLGNQIFQYIFVRYAETYYPGEGWYFDDSYFYVNNVHNGYELEKVFHITPNLLSNYFDRDVWAEIIRLKKQGSSLPQTLLDMGMPVTMLAEADTYTQFNPFSGEIIKSPANQFQPEVLEISRENIYYHGYWINKNWLEGCKKQMISELKFPKLADEKNLRYAEMINKCISVGIHIRRGDFVKLGWSMPAEYYRMSCQEVLNSWPNVRFFVFSDDIVWCQEKAEELGLHLTDGTVYITGNVNGKNYVDLQLLSMCRGIIMSGSCFCYLAALLNEGLQFVVNPFGYEI